MFQATWPQVHITHLSHSFFRFTGFPDDSPVVSPPERFERINDKGKHPFIHLPGVLKPGRSSYLFLSFFELSRTFYLYSYFKSIVCNNSQVPGFFYASGRLRFGPRSFGGPPILDYEVQFPLGRPTSDNLRAICVNGDRRPSYPESYFPASGFGQQKRKASAVNKAESWFSTCCQGNQTWGTEVTLCCATQAVSFLPLANSSLFHLK